LHIIILITRYCEQLERHRRAVQEREAAAKSGEGDALHELKQRVAEAEQASWQAAAAEHTRRAQLAAATCDLISTR
jgi:hypothetical protein